MDISDITTCTLVALVLCLTMTASAYPVIDEVNGGSIVVGEHIPIEEVPWQVALINSDGDHFCGGAIFSKRFIITSAYCTLYKKPEDIRVRSGSKLRNEGGFLSNVKRATRHEKYGHKRREMYRPEAPTYDIALIELSELLEFGPGTAAISLYNPDETPQPFAGNLIQLTGWGYIAELGGELSDILLEINIPILSGPNCHEIYHDDNSFCAGNREEHMVSCSGDSGGPVVWKGKLLGIVSGSQGVACPGPEFAGAVTSIEKFSDWIITNAF